MHNAQFRRKYFSGAKIFLFFLEKSNSKANQKQIKSKSKANQKKINALNFYLSDVI